MARLRFEATPNANAYKVTVPEPFCVGSRIMSSPDKATTPVAKALFAVPGVQALFFLNDFVTVTKRPEADWDAVLPRVKEALEQNPHVV